MKEYWTLLFDGKIFTTTQGTGNNILPDTIFLWAKKENAEKELADKFDSRRWKTHRIKIKTDDSAGI